MATITPFGVRGENRPYTVNVPPGSVTYDPQSQLNVTADGQPWCETRMPASCENTNYDSKNDDTPDPY